MKTRTLKSIFNERRTITIAHNDKHGDYHRYRYYDEDGKHEYIAKQPQSKHHFLMPDIPFKLETKREYCILGTVFAILSSFLEWFAGYSKFLSYPHGLIKDGYALVLLSPFLIIYWATLIISYIPILFITIILYIPASLWTLIFELPASYINGDKPLMAQGKIDIR